MGLNFHEVLQKKSLHKSDSVNTEILVFSGYNYEEPFMEVIKWTFFLCNCHFMKNGSSKCKRLYSMLVFCRNACLSFIVYLLQIENVAKITDVLRCSLERQLSTFGGFMHNLNIGMDQLRIT